MWITQTIAHKIGVELSTIYTQGIVNIMLMRGLAIALCSLLALGLNHVQADPIPPTLSVYVYEQGAPALPPFQTAPVEGYVCVTQPPEASVCGYTTSGVANFVVHGGLTWVVVWVDPRWFSCIENCEKSLTVDEDQVVTTVLMRVQRDAFGVFLPLVNK